MGAIIMLLIPLSSIGLLFLKDAKKERKLIMNILLILNALFFLSPMIMAFFNTPHGESMWNENTGGGAFLWLYLLVLPVSGIVQIILLVLKITYANNSK